MADFGYDVSDHCDVDPVFGSLDDADRLIEAAHAAGLKVLLDWVPNHTSDQHPWFLDSRDGRGSARRSWYVWRDGRDGGRGVGRSGGSERPQPPRSRDQASSSSPSS